MKHKRYILMLFLAVFIVVGGLLVIRKQEQNRFALTWQDKNVTSKPHIDMLPFNDETGGGIFVVPFLACQSKDYKLPLSSSNPGHATGMGFYVLNKSKEKFNIELSSSQIEEANKEDVLPKNNRLDIVGISKFKNQDAKQINYVIKSKRESEKDYVVTSKSLHTDCLKWQEISK